jgi:hypothetical protein
MAGLSRFSGQENGRDTKMNFTGLRSLTIGPVNGMHGLTGLGRAVLVTGSAANHFPSRRRSIEDTSFSNTPL